MTVATMRLARQLAGMSAMTFGITPPPILATDDIPIESGDTRDGHPDTGPNHAFAFFANSDGDNGSTTDRVHRRRHGSTRQFGDSIAQTPIPLEVSGVNDLVTIEHPATIGRVRDRERAFATA